MRFARKQQWALVAGTAGTLGAQLAQRGLDAAWRRATGYEPPDDPTSREVDLLTALAWAAAAGAVVGIAQVLAHRGAAALWAQALGSRPPRKRRRVGHRR